MIKKLLTIFILSSIAHVSYADSIQGRKNGVEFNFPRILTYTKDWISMSGTFSRFNHQTNTEIALPWLVAKYGQGDTALTTKSIDIHYRKFLGDELDGFYLSAFSRLAHYNGKVYKEGSHDVSTGSDSSITNNSEDYNKFRFGIGVGLGVRVFPKNKRMYWGSGLIIGRYLDLEEQDFINEGDTSFAGPFAESSSIIIDVELLKFGYAF
ncbi:MAG: hypothetical protein V3V19_00055 [Cocleimonas sp.]